MVSRLLLATPPGYHNIAQRFFRNAGFEHVALLAADGALEAAPAMGCADIILDLVSTGELRASAWPLGLSTATQLSCAGISPRCSGCNQH